MSKALKTYHDLCKEIEIVENRCEQLEKEVTRIFKLMYTPPATNLTASLDDMPRGGRDQTSFDRLYVMMIHAENELNTMRDVLTDKRLAKRRIEDKIGEFEGLEYRVAYKRDIQGKALDIIADELKYSASYIEKISARTPRLKIG